MFLTDADVRSLASKLGLERSAFLARHCTEQGDRTTLRSEGARCEFQAADGSCSVYEARPQQCRSWPFWRENLERETWERDVLPLCAGAGKGRLHSAREIEEIARRDEQWYADPALRPSSG